MGESEFFFFFSNLVYFFHLSFFSCSLLFPFDAKSGGFPLDGCHGQSPCVCVEIDRCQERPLTCLFSERNFRYRKAVGLMLDCIESVRRLL